MGMNTLQQPNLQAERRIRRPNPRLPRRMQGAKVKRMGGPEDDSLHSIAILPGGGTVAVGGTESCGAGGGDMLAVGLDEGGNLSWMKTYGGEEDEGVMSMDAVSGGGIVLLGVTDSFGTGKRAIIIRTDDAGGIADACPPGFIGESSAVVSEATLAVTEASIGSVEMVAGRRDASVSRQPLTALVETICG
jgi:hypothetical protein